MAEPKKYVTFNDWINLANQKGVSLDLSVNREADIKRLEDCGLPTFIYKRFDENDREGIRKFYDKYGHLVVILYPRVPGVGGQPWINTKDLPSIEKLLDDNQPLSRYIIRVGQQRDAQFGGTILSDYPDVTCELGEGIQANLAHNKSANIWRAESSFGMPFHYSPNSTEEVKEHMWNALKHLKYGKDFLKGYFEFFVCSGDIYFVDYKTDTRFFKVKSPNRISRK